MYELVWFIGGAIAYKFLARLFALYQATTLFKSLEINVLIMFAAIAEDVAFIKALRYKTMVDSGLEQEQIDENRDRDEEFFDSWKKSCIRNIYASVPSYIKPSFSTWNEGMNLMKKYVREYKREKQ